MNLITWFSLNENERENLFELKVDETQTGGTSLILKTCAQSLLAFFY
jgi:hypothetical protein